jgi:glycosyltransferase involved in cell wall biosynthesis
MISSQKVVLGIDAMNIRDGGGLTHLYEILNSADVNSILFDQVIVWSNNHCLEHLPIKPWLIKINPLIGSNSVIKTTLWQIFSLGRSARKMNCNILFIAGGSALTSFSPQTTICHNMLPFSDSALNLYPMGIRKFKFFLLRFFQLFTFRRTDGIIFLSEWARENIINRLDKRINSIVIPHGINPAFTISDRQHRSIDEATSQNPFILLYVSRIEPYKHQLEVIEIVDKIRKETGWPLQLQLAGLASDSLYNILVQQKIRQVDLDNAWIRNLGSVNYRDLENIYRNADIGIFASSCENMPIILLEKMAAGLPILCNSVSPMKDYLKDQGIYIDINDINTSADKLRLQIKDLVLRKEHSRNCIQLASQYSWINSSLTTFRFLFSSIKN